MQFTLLDLLRFEHIGVGMNASDADSAIRSLNALLVESGHATAGYAEDVCAREQTFPTGLPTEPFAVAIPHADPKHVLSSAVAIGTLRTPVPFSQMGTDGSVRLDVSVVFLLAIKEQEKQVGMIQQLMSIIQSPALLTAVSKATTSGEVVELLRTSLSA